MIETVTSEYAPDALITLRESFALHLSATRAEKTTRITWTRWIGSSRTSSPPGCRPVRVASTFSRSKFEMVRPTPVELTVTTPAGVLEGGAQPAALPAFHPLRR